MKIAVIFDSFPKAGGVFYQSLQSCHLLKKLEKEDTEIIYITLFDEVTKSLKSYGNFRTITFEKMFLLKIYYYLFSSKILRYFAKTLGFKNPYSKFLKKNNVDLIIFLGPSWLIKVSDGLNFIMSPLDINFKLNNFFPEYLNDKTFQTKDEIIKKSCDQAFKIIVDTPRSKNELKNIYNCPQDKIVVHPFTPALPDIHKRMDKNKISDSFKKFNLSSKKYIFYPSQFWAHKNHKYIVESVYLLKQKNIEIDVIFCGSDKGNLKFLKNLIKQKKLEKNFHIYNFISEEEIISLYLNSLCLVMPTYVARSTLPLYESFYFKKPVFYSKNILDEELEKYVETFDLKNPKTLTEKLENLIKNKNNLSNKIYEAYNYYNKNCTDENFLNNYGKIINEFKYLKSMWK